MSANTLAFPAPIPEEHRLYRFRRKLGRWKSLIIDQWPYRHRMRRAQALRLRYRPLLRELTPLRTHARAVYEIHMLCGKRDLDMGIWASWSLMRFLDGEARLVVHSDGTLSEPDVELWRAIVGHLVIIPREERNRVVSAGISSLAPKLHAWRCTNWASTQLVDSHFFGEASRMILMDSDVLVFSRPAEVLAAATAAEPVITWCNDLRDAYSASRELIKAVTGVMIPPRLCAGFMVTPRFGPDDFQTIESAMSAMAADGRISLNHFWSCQTYYALAAARRTAKPLPPPYSNSDGATAAEMPLRHYVGIPKVRHRYFTEGLTSLVGELHRASSVRLN